jgi:hypothetical protein
MVQSLRLPLPQHDSFFGGDSDLVHFFLGLPFGVPLKPLGVTFFSILPLATFFYRDSVHVQLKWHSVDNLVVLHKPTSIFLFLLRGLRAFLQPSNLPTLSLGHGSG